VPSTPIFASTLDTLMMQPPLLSLTMDLIP
jgi:hypothetical protein